MINLLTLIDNEHIIPKDGQKNIQMTKQSTQQEIAHQKLAKHGILRLAELNKFGVSSTAVSRMVERGKVTRLSHGLYQLPYNQNEIDHDYALVAKQIPNGVFCLVSALYINKVIRKKPTSIWVAIPQNNWVPDNLDPKVRVIRFSDKIFNESVKKVIISGVEVKVYDVAKTLSDCFRHRHKIGPEIAYKSLELAIYHRKTSISEIIDQAILGGVAKVMRPRVEVWFVTRSI